ncbi:MAG TPA: glycosyltransferase family 1 protein [Flavobacterium sp.]|jgi:glycosyltransferase involved in cell wall biosynthesis
MKTVFLESHNIKNLHFGFGQFNYHLLKALDELKQDEIKYVAHTSDIAFLKKELSNRFGYRKYMSLRRYPLFRIRQKYDLWHSLNQNTKIEPYHKLPYLLTVHNTPFVRDPNDYMEKPEHVKFQEKLDRSDAITYISEYAKMWTHKYYTVPSVPEFVIYNGNPITDTATAPDFVPDFIPKQNYLFSIGEVSQRKNFISLVRMMPFLPDFDLVIAGKDSTKIAEEIRQEITLLQLQDRVKLVGKVSDQARKYYYQNCTAFVFPSLREGFGLPVIEAMRFGKPVIMSNLTSLPEIGGGLAYLWDHFDSGYMAEVVRNGLTDFNSRKPELVEKCIARGSQFTWENAAKHYHEVYLSMMK